MRNRDTLASPTRQTLTEYILKQLASFQSNMRNIAVMHGVHGVAQNLRTPEMQAVAEYLESLP